MDPTPTEFEPAAQWPNKALRITFLSMAVVLVCVSIIAVLIAASAARATNVADSAQKAADDLRTELACRATPALDYDRESSELQAMIAHGLAGVATGQFDDPEGFATALNEQVEIVDATLKAREASLLNCVAP